MKRGKQAAGYTIIEVMIVLAVSGIMFVLAANFINGQQPRTSFKTGVGEMASRTQDLVTQVVEGRYTDIRYTCNSSGSPVTADISGGTIEQGQNSGCVFLGKVFFFDYGSDATKYHLVSLAGARQTLSGLPAVTLADARPGVIQHLTDDLTVSQSLDVPVVWVKSGATYSKTHAFGVTQGLGVAETIPDSDSAYKNGTQLANLVAAPGATTLADPINGGLSVVDQVEICITDDQRYAVLTLGGQGTALGVAIKYYNDKASAEAGACSTGASYGTP